MLTDGLWEQVSSEQGEGVMKVPGGGRIQQRGGRSKNLGLEQAAFLGSRGREAKRCGGD